MLDKPSVVPLYRTLKLLLGLDQKVRDQAEGLQRFSPADDASPAERHDLTRSVTSAERGKPVVLPQGKANRKVSRWDCGYRRREEAKAGL
jgi:hypothetical protein